MNKKTIKRFVVLWGLGVAPLSLVVFAEILLGINWFWFFIGALGFCGLECMLVAIGLYFPKIGKRIGVHRDDSWGSQGDNS